MSILTHKLNKTVLAAVMGLSAGSLIPQLSVAQNAKPSEIVRVKLDIDGPDNEWIRIERTGSLVRLIHTTRSARTNGVGGIANFLIDAAGPSQLAFSRWHDHKTTRIQFEPDYCSTNQTIQDIPNTPPKTDTSNSQLRLALNSECAVVGTDTLILPEGVGIYQGQFRIEYIERKLLRTIIFRLPKKK